MKEKLKYLVTVILSAAIIFGFSVWFLFGEPTAYSEAERRALKQLPEFSIEAVLSGKYMSEFEDYDRMDSDVDNLVSKPQSDILVHQLYFLK